MARARLLGISLGCVLCAVLAVPWTRFLIRDTATGPVAEPVPT
jgi:hypothetical protein